MAKQQSEKPQIIVELETLFKETNESLFGGQLKLPTMILQPERKLDFRFVADTYHFVVGARFLDFKSVESMYEQFLHEMLHVKLDDDSTNSSYHNSTFLKAALEVGFFVGRNRTIGWGLTHFNPPADDDTIECPTQAAVDARSERTNSSSEGWTKQAILSKVRLCLPRAPQFHPLWSQTR